MEFVYLDGVSLNNAVDMGKILDEGKITHRVDWVNKEMGKYNVVVNFPDPTLYERFKNKMVIHLLDLLDKKNLSEKSFLEDSYEWDNSWEGSWYE